MPGIAAPIGRRIFPFLLLSLTSSAALQWAGLSAQSEAARHHNSAQKLNELSAILINPAAEETAVVQQAADKLNASIRDEKLVEAARRVSALASYPDASVRDRLRAEVRSLVHEAESMETAALSRATLYTWATEVLIVLAAGFCGLLWLRRRIPELA